MAKRSNGEGSYKKLPSGKWSAQLMVGYTDEGKRRIKTFTAPTKSEVKRKIEQYFEDLAVEKEQAKTLSFSEWADIWYADHKSEVEESTYWSYSFTLKTLKDYFGDRPVSEIKQLDINRFLDVLVERKRSKSTIAKCKSMLFQIFASAADNDLVTKNPVVRAKKVKKAAKEGQKMNKRSAFSQEEVEIMKRDLPNNLLGNSILTLIGTGMRVQELLALTKDDIAPDGSFIRVDKLNEAEGIWYVTDHVTEEKDATHFIPTKDGKLILKGLEDDTYTWTEVQTANGYTLLKNSIKVVISQTESETLCGIYGTDVLGLIQNDPRYADVDPGLYHNMPQRHLEHKLLTASATVDSNKVNMEPDGSSANAFVPFTVINTRGFDLPQTGSYGNWMFPVAGLSMLTLCVVGIVALTRKSKKKAQNT